MIHSVSVVTTIKLLTKDGKGGYLYSDRYKNEVRSVATPSRLFRLYAQRVIAYRWVVLLTTLALTVFWGSRMGTLQLDTDPKTWTPQKHPYVTTTNLLEDVFGGKNIAVIGIVPKTGDVYQPQGLAKIQRIQACIEQIPPAVRHNILSFEARTVKPINGRP